MKTQLHSNKEPVDGVSQRDISNRTEQPTFHGSRRDKKVRSKSTTWWPRHKDGDTIIKKSLSQRLVSQLINGTMSP